MAFSPQRYALFARLPRWLYHALFWTAYFGVATVIALSNRPIHHWTFYLQLLTLLPPDMLQVYLNLNILVPRLLFCKRYALYFSTLLISVSLHSALFIGLHGYYTHQGETGFNYVKDFTIGNFLIQELNIFSLIGLTTGIKFLKDWMRQERQWQEKEKQHIQTELDFLRSQIHPHFFFNTLNNLYSLTVRKSDEAPEVVLKLSNLMSYMLYGSGEPLVALDKELANLENYIALEKLRYGARLTLCFEKNGNTSPLEIPPLLLISFVENSFKHGLKGRIGAVRIDICLRVEKEALFFEVRNPAGAGEKVREPLPGGPDSEPGGIGLLNVRRRLDILYGDRYDLQLARRDDLFETKLKIAL